MFKNLLRGLWPRSEEAKAETTIAYNTLPELKPHVGISEEWLGKVEVALQGLHQNELSARFSTVSEVVQDGILTLDASGTVLSANRKACDLLGVDSLNLLGSKANKLPVCIPFSDEDVVLEKNGRQIKISVKEGERGFLYAVLTDVTENVCASNSLKSACCQRSVMKAIGSLATRVLTSKSICTEKFIAAYLKEVGMAAGVSSVMWFLTDVEASSVSLKHFWVDDDSLGSLIKASNKSYDKLCLTQEELKGEIEALKQGEVIRPKCKWFSFGGSSIIVPVLIKGALYGFMVYCCKPEVEIEEEFLDILKLGSATISAVMERHDLEHKILENDRFIRSLSRSLNALSDPVIISDTEDKIVFVNFSFERRYGYNLCDIQGLSYEKLLAEDSRIIYHNSVEKTVKKGLSWHGTLSGLSKAGEKIRSFMSITPLLSDADFDLPSYRLTTLIGAR